MTTNLRDKTQKKKGENELLGVTLKVTSVILQSINWVVARFIYINNPDLVGS